MADRHGGDDLVAAFTRWTANQRAEAAATDRARERSLRDQARASATWIGILVDLAEQATTVTAVVATQRRRGRVVGVGPDFCVFESLLGAPTLIGLDAISAVWPDPAPAGAHSSADPRSRLTATPSAGPSPSASPLRRAGPNPNAGPNPSSGPSGSSGSGTGSGPRHLAGGRGPALDLSLIAALSMLAEERSPVCFVTSTGDEAAGELVAAGEDVLTLRSGPPERRLAYVKLSAVALCDLR